MDIKICVGGRDFTTSKSTLDAFPDSVLSRALAFAPEKKDLGQWDRDPDIFSSLLSYYRTHRFVPPPNVPLATVKEELLFWGFEMEWPTKQPQWPVLPFPPRPRGTTTTTVPYSLGQALRKSAAGCPLVILCNLWSSIRRSCFIWMAAQCGFRNVCIFWKVRCIGLDPMMVISHMDFLQNLAALDGCTFECIGKMESSELQNCSRPHDVHTNGLFTSDMVSEHVHEWTLPASCRIDNHDPAEVAKLVVQILQENHKTTFDFRGFRVSVEVSQDRVWWYMNPVVDGQEVHDADPSPHALQDLSGFVLDLYVRLGNLVLHTFSLPTSEYRSSRLWGDIFLVQSYSPKQSRSWYLCPERRSLHCEMATLQEVHEACATETNVTLIFEAKTESRLQAYPVQEIILRRDVTHGGVFFDKFLIQW